ncbi:hypothetical protein D1872_279870 [compost metagenome]
MAADIFTIGMTKLEIAVKETTITIPAEINPACTAAWPSTNAPTMEIADPTTRGIRTPASRIISKVISMMKASSKAGNGIPSRWAVKLNNSGVGISSC